MNIQLIQIRKENNQVDFRDLFIYTSLQCNLQCKHCFVSSSPLNKTLDAMTAEDIKPFLMEAKALNVRHIYFTGGEPFINPDMIKMIDAALAIAPVTIYTNATRPLGFKLNELLEVLRKHENKVMLRVSLDHYDKDIHEQYYGRGEGNFALAIENTIKAAHLGIDVAITTQEDIHNNATNEQVERMMRNLFVEKGVALADVKVLPRIPQGEEAKRIQITNTDPISPAEFEQSGVPQTNLMCHVGRTVIKYDNTVRVFPCTILIPPSKASIPKFAKYEMGRSLKASLDAEQPLDHPSCRAYCVQGKQTCSNQ